MTGKKDKRKLHSDRIFGLDSFSFLHSLLNQFRKMEDELGMGFGGFRYICNRIVP